MKKRTIYSELAEKITGMKLVSCDVEGEGEEVLVPTFEIACNPTINLREMVEFKMRFNGVYVPIDEKPHDKSRA